MLAVHIQQRALEAVRFAFQRHDLLLCQGDIVVDNGSILTIDCEDVLSRSEGMWESLCRR